MRAGEDFGIRYSKDKEKMGKGYRQGRLAEEIRKIISELLINGIKDPRVAGQMISISGVSVTADGSFATCYVSVLSFGEQTAEEKEAAEAEILAGLGSAKGLMKKEIARQVKLRHVPELIFKIDHSMDYGRHIDEILSTIDFDSYQPDEPEESEEQ